ncbi:protein adenylyltransferase SelO family protein [Synechococcus sp. UW179A]|uniref:protein adenylyltransferase SelO family protein n=1 Tax=Synechococcus sp. UW179A TaxID=2575510 RepID=UPI000E0FA40E|nr:protein adenylyltransferase SelO family protein [Synechococcus sp. UW179A]
MPVSSSASSSTDTFAEFAEHVDYSLLSQLKPDPEARVNGHDHQARQVKSGHYVPVTPTPLPAPEYVAHSEALFDELGLNHGLAVDDSFRRLFSGDISVNRGAMLPYGWATGYALSIYGTEYDQQCPFGNGNGYGDGRAVSVFEGLFEGRRWEMQLKGGGPTPYCRGADGRAVLRSSVREFLAQEFMHALGVPTSRSLTLYVSHAESVRRPWYSDQSRSMDPDVLVENPAAITTRVAPSFLRVGQLELFARRFRRNSHPKAFNELQMIVQHLIERNYQAEIETSLPFSEQVVKLAKLFRGRLTALVADWIRVGYCQGNFNSDNCAAGGFTLDYGPFGFCELFDPRFQPWTGGGMHFAFFNQPVAASKNYQMFVSALKPLLHDHPEVMTRLESLEEGFKAAMQEALDSMWQRKLGLSDHCPELVEDLLQLCVDSAADYTMVFRELSAIPEHVAPLKRSFYRPSDQQIDQRWMNWLQQWRGQLERNSDLSETSRSMQLANPAITWREWLIAPAYEQAAHGDYSLVHELQRVFAKPYESLPVELAARYDQLKPEEFFNAGGISHYSCSS